MKSYETRPEKTTLTRENEIHFENPCYQGPYTLSLKPQQKWPNLGSVALKPVVPNRGVAAQ